MKNTSHKNRKKPSDHFSVTHDSPLLTYMIAVLPHKKRNLLKAVLRDQQVLVDGQPVTQFDHPLKKGMELEVCWEKRPSLPPMHGISIVYQDQEVIVVNKPTGLLSVATKKERDKTVFAILSKALKNLGESDKLFIVHRLEREMSGLLLFARNEEAKRHIRKHWPKTRPLGRYLAVVEGSMKTQHGTITSWLTESKALKVYSSENPQHGEKSTSRYRTLKSGDDYSLVEVTLETGHKHQIRVHFQELGYPVAGDIKYGAKTRPLKHLALQAQTLAFHHPGQDRVVTIEAPKIGRFERLISPPQ